MSKCISRIAFHTSIGLSTGLQHLKGLVEELAEFPHVSVIQVDGGYNLSMRQVAEAMPDGVIATLLTQESLEIARSMGVPAVNIADHLDAGSIPTVCTDNVVVGRKAAEHLLHTGLNHFAFLGREGVMNSEIRLRGFREELERHGKRVHVPSRPLETSALWKETCAAIAEFLGELPKPLGLYCSTDRLARQALEAAESIRCNVPGDLAVVGTGSNTYDAVLARPSLSTIPLRLDVTARTALRLLVEMMEGHSVPPVTFTRSGPLVLRASSSTFYSENPSIGKALAYMGSHYPLPIRVEEIAQKAGLSRRVLEKRFREEKGTSVYAFLLETRFHHAKQLLLDTRLPVEKIAERCGFRESRYLNAHMRKTIGTTPGEYRKSRQVSSSLSEPDRD